MKIFFLSQIQPCLENLGSVVLNNIYLITVKFLF